ncbi:MAG: Bacterial transcriptional activator domain protein [Chlorobi bacterium OLB5]|nr:MAG: Bacterial transcriptional activator domain protein [Chlorobi bacterium OLB5]
MIYEDKTLAINKPGECYIDLSDFNTAIKQASLTDNKKEKINFFKKAAELYSGNVLEGYYESWCEELREQYREKFIAASEQLILMLEERSLNEDLIQYTEKLLQYDRLNLSAFKSLIKHFIKTGNKAKALKSYEKFKKDYYSSFEENLPEKSVNEIEELFN